MVAPIGKHHAIKDMAAYQAMHERSVNPATADASAELIFQLTGDFGLLSEPIVFVSMGLYSKRVVI